MNELEVPNAIGFLTVVKHEAHGFFGGYLLLNSNGRPLEFHCTAPVKPNRAQEILYGPTLEPYLYGEQIGQTLIAKSKSKPLIVCTDLAAVLAAREFVSVPVVLIEPESDKTPPLDRNAAPTWRIDDAHRQSSLLRFEWGRRRMAVSTRYDGDQSELSKRLAGVAEDLDLAEPFDRIRGAIEEAQRAGR